MISKKLLLVLAACFLSAATILMMPFAVSAHTGFPLPDKPGCPTKATLIVDADDTMEIAKTTRLSALTIGEGATLTAPSGYSLTLTLNGVETPIEEGIYKGNIVLTVTENIVVIAGPGPGGPGGPTYWRSAVYVEDGAYVPEKSVAAAVAGGKATNTSAKNIKITSVGPLFNGIIATSSDSSTTPYSYSITNPKIKFTGNGGNDFTGYGFAICSKGYADVAINNARIITDGVIRGATFVGGHSTMHVNNSFIHTGNPPLPEVITGMMSVPWPLGISGTCRSTMVCENGTAYYKNSHIVAEGWGALSTDAVQSVSLNADNCIIETIESGYGAYADGSSIDTFSKCKFYVADMALIMTQGSGIFTNGTVVNSGRFGVMQHSGRGGETLTINKSCVFNTDEAVIMIKSSAPTIAVDNAKLNPKNGVILQVMVSDDPGSGKNGGTVNATFSNMTMKGDIINSMTTMGDLNTTLKNANITGAITTSIWETEAEIEGIDLSAMSPFDPAGAAYSYLIGNGVNTYCDPGDTYGATVSLDKDSKWVVNKTSYLTGLTIAEGAIITAPKHQSLTMTVNGTKTKIAAGSYTGKIVLTLKSH